ncbi:hypothetical protein EGW08_018425, partial [Elysia chlorotica]
CERTQFPDLGKTYWVKFRRGFHENAELFKSIENGSCPCSSMISKRTVAVMPEMAAAASGNVKMLRSLTEPWLKLKTQATSNKQSKKPQNAVDQFPSKSNIKITKSERCPRLSVDFMSKVERFGESKIGMLLQHSLYGGSDAVVDHLLSGMDPWPLSLDETMSCFHMCMLMSRDDLFYRLAILSGSPDTLSRAYHTGTPLMVAASYGRTLLVNLLIAGGASPLLQNADGVTAVHMALESDYKDSEIIVLRMLTAAPCPELYSTFIATALRSRKFLVAKYLIDQGVTTVREHTHRRSALEVEIPLLHWWMNRFEGQVFKDVLEFLLSQDLDVNFRDATTGDTALHMAVRQHQDAGLVEMFAAKGARVNATNTRGETPLLYSLIWNQPKHFGSFIKVGATISDPERMFTSALEKRMFQIVLILLHAGYTPSSANLELLAQLGPRVPEPTQVLISTVMSEPTPLPMLCALSLREAFGDGLNPYLTRVGCPSIIRRFIHLEHLMERFLDPVSWSKILQWNAPHLSY